MPWPPTQLPSLVVATDTSPQRTQHAADHNSLAVIANGVLATAWVNVNPIGGAAPAFVNSFANYSPAQGAGWQQLRFRKELGDICRMEGLVQGGASGATIFTLPLGYRPAANRRFPITGSTTAGSPTYAWGYLDVQSVGIVYATMVAGGGSGNWTAIDLWASWVIDPASL